MRWKTLLAGTTALMLAGSCLSYAQQPAAGDKVSPPPSAKRLPLEDRAAIVDARIAAHKTALKLTPDQEKLWPAYETALRNLAKLRVERYQEQKATSPVALLRQRADDLSSASVALKQLADAEEPLLNSFDDTQKQLFSTYASNARDRRDRTKR